MILISRVHDLQVGTYKYVKTNGGIYVAYIGRLVYNTSLLLFSRYFKESSIIFSIMFPGAFLLALLCLGRSIYYCTMKISLIEGPM